ncbi:methyltransferase domain-containing protein [Microbispora sp. NEAU-D428]|uniref:methyltransferase domain-containing protein n=1 Tax=Microbispora sitophila TaxID=2771537 RepID=UPI0018687E76|nr:methyltransferase domain-containing protein [Microbispora sitophila]MBE3015206.1 methyltransferase domain-containing protein [Microbispora sitophila]
MDDAINIETRWMAWGDSGDEILDLRRRAFTGEQGWGEEMVRHPMDPDGLHLCAISGGEIVAVTSAYVYEPGAPELAALGLPATDGLTVQLSKRVEAPAFRGRYISKRLGMAVVRQVYESLRPDRFFLVLKGDHRHLTDRYSRGGFVKHAESGSGDDPVMVMKVEGDKALEELYLEYRALMAVCPPGGTPMSFPSLVRFLADDKREDLLAVAGLGAENLYVEPLSLDTELPRLTAQDRLVLAEQRARLASTPLPPAPASLLDIGSGPGTYLAAISQEAPFAGYRVRGVEPAAQLLAKARASFPELTFRQGSAYATGEEDASHDVITANFLFIHLRNPDLALLEMSRVLRPGGLLYVVDVNDTTYRGPAVIRRLIESYDRAYAGDRTILADLPRRAAQFGFELVRNFSTRVTNTGGAKPEFGPDEIRVDRAAAWQLISFMSSQRGLEDVYREARDHYFSSSCEGSMNIETQVYRKCSVHDAGQA